MVLVAVMSASLAPLLLSPVGVAHYCPEHGPIEPDIVYSLSLIHTHSLTHSLTYKLYSLSHTYIHTYMYIHTYIYTYIHTYTHTHTHTEVEGEKKAIFKRESHTISSHSAKCHQLVFH